MSIWAQLGDDVVAGFVADGQTSLMIVAGFSFSGQEVPEGARVSFLVGRGELPPDPIEDDNGNKIVKTWTESDILSSIVALDGVRLSAASAVTQKRLVRDDNDKLAAKVVASVTLRPISDQSLDSITVVAYSSYDKLGKVTRLQPEELVLTNITKQQDGALYLNVNERLDPVANKWETKAPMPTNRSGAFSAESGGKIYVIGGFNGNFSDACEEYDPAADSWSTMVPTPNPRGFGMSVSLGGKIYCLGGYDFSTTKRASSLAESFDPVANAWATLSPMPFPVSFGAAQAIGNKIYVLFGVSSFRVLSASSPETIDEFNMGVLAYDVLADSWSMTDVLPPSPPATTNLSSAATAGAFSLNIPTNLSLPPYGFLAIDRAGSPEVVKYKSYVAGEGKVVLSLPLSLGHAAGQTVDLASLPENRISPASVLNGALIQVFNGLSYLGYSSSATREMRVTTGQYDPASGAYSVFAAGPNSPGYRAGGALVAGKLYFYGGSNDASEWQNKTQSYDLAGGPIPASFAGPTGLAKMAFERHSMGSASSGGHAWAIGGGGSGHPPGWLKVTATANPSTVRADGKETSGILVEATDAAGDPPADGTRLKVTGYIYSSLTEQEQASLKPPASPSQAATTQKISILPLLLSSRNLAMKAGKAATTLRERSEDPITEVANLLNYVKGNESVPNQEALKAPASDDRSRVIQAGQVRPLYDAAIEMEVLDDFYFGKSDTDSAIAGASPADLGGGEFSFNPQAAAQGLSATVSFYSDIASIPDVMVAERDSTATVAKATLDEISYEVPFGASPLYDALFSGAHERNIQPNPLLPLTNLMLASSDNDSNSSSYSPQDVVDEANGVAETSQFPLFVTSFVVTEPISLSARRSRTDVADLEMISTETGGNSFSVVDPIYIPFVIQRIKTSAPSSIGSGTITNTHGFDGYLSSVRYVVSNLVAGNVAEMRLWHSLDGYNFTDVGVLIPPNYSYVLPVPARAKFARYQVRLQSKTFNSPLLESVAVEYIKPNVQFLFTYPKDVGGQVSELAGVSNARLPAGGLVEMGLAHGESFMFDRDYANESQPTIQDRGVIQAINRSFDTFIGSVSTMDSLVTDDLLIYRSKSGSWAQEAAIVVYLNNVNLPPDDYLSVPEQGLVAMRKKLSPNDEVSMEVINPPSFRVGVRVENPSLSKGVLDNFAFCWGETESPGGKLNRAPQAVNLFISSPALPGGPLEANYTFVDPDGDPEDKSKALITWYRNGAAIPSLANKRKVSNSDLIASRPDAAGDLLISKGQEWFFAVRPSDGVSYGPLSVSPKVMIANVPPKASNARLTSSNSDPAKFTSSDTVTALFDFTDPDDPSPKGVIYAWFVNGVETKSGDSNSLSPDDKDVNDKKALAPGNAISCEITPSDGTDFGAPVTTSAVTIMGSPPKVSNVLLSPSAPSVLSTVKLTYDYEDVDELPDLSKVMWYRDGERVSELDDQKSLSPLSLAPTQEWSVVVTPYNGSMEGESVKSNAIVVQF